MHVHANEWLAFNGFQAIFPRNLSLQMGRKCIPNVYSCMCVCVRAKSRRLSVNGNGIVCTCLMECWRFSHAHSSNFKCFGTISVVSNQRAPIFGPLNSSNPPLNSSTSSNFTGNLCDTSDLVVRGLSFFVCHLL